MNIVLIALISVCMVCCISFARDYFDIKKEMKQEREDANSFLVVQEAERIANDYIERKQNENRFTG